MTIQAVTFEVVPSIPPPRRPRWRYLGGFRDPAPTYPAGTRSLLIETADLEGMLRRFYFPGVAVSGG